MLVTRHSILAGLSPMRGQSDGFQAACGQPQPREVILVIGSFGGLVHDVGQKPGDKLMTNTRVALMLASVCLSSPSRWLNETPSIGG